MDQEIQDQALHYVAAAWMGLPKRRRPPCLWVHLHEPVAAFADGLTTPLLAAWFLDANELRRRNLWEFVRFWVVHHDQPWCGRMQGEPSRIFGDPHEIGLAGFAQCQGTADVYLEVSWGGRDGRGVLLMTDDRGKLQEKAEVWVS